jgi:DivIVA domain-containing protein
MGHEDRDLIPLGSAFDVARRGYDRDQVNAHLDRVDADMRILTADRDAAVARAAELVKQVENQRAQIISNERDMARLAAAPASMESMGERVQRILRLAQDEASEIRIRAETQVAELISRTEADGNALRERYQRLITEVERRRAAMEAEHESVMSAARAQANQLVTDATEQAQQTETESAERRRRVEEDFDIAMTARRNEAMRALAELEATSKAEAQRRIKEASAEADRRIQEATQIATRLVTEAKTEADRLRSIRDRIEGQLRQVRSVLVEATETIEARPEEGPLPQVQAGPPADATRPLAANAAPVATDHPTRAYAESGTG